MSDDALNDAGLLPVQRKALSRSEWREQALLFDELDLGSELLSIEQDAAANKHTGGTLAKRRELRDAICLKLVEGVSIRKVCHEFGVGRNTVSKMVKRLEAAGEMEPYKKRVSERMGRIIEGGVELMEELIEKGSVPTSVLPVMVGVISDKKALIDGEPTAILGKVDGGLSKEAYDKWLDGLTSAKAIDSQSTEGKPNGQ